jgi:hypothetical protein
MATQIYFFATCSVTGLQIAGKRVSAAYYECRYEDVLHANAFAQSAIKD